ncbi:MAG: hypothetical protein HS113_06300 [Verrucomicrobiales bacterium]|nr:hypothetical protein [Verrucomicrobiales bacterium]
MHDSQVVGLRHPTTQEVLLGSILGRLRSLFALTVYRGRSGHRWLLNTILDAGCEEDAEALERGFDQDLVKAEFVTKAALISQDRAVLAASGFRPTNRRGPVWPQFRSVVPGCCPWFLTEAEAETLLFALPRVAAVSRLVRANPAVWDNHLDGEIAFLPAEFDPAGQELQASDLDWHPMLPPPEAPPEPVRLAESVVAHLLQLPFASRCVLEVNVAYAPIPMAAPERPFLPKGAMVVDRASGMVGSVLFGPAEDRDGAGVLATVLEGALVKFGLRPETLVVRRPRVQTMLQRVAAELGCGLELEPELPALDRAWESLMQRFSQRQ